MGGNMFPPCYSQPGNCSLCSPRENELVLSSLLFLLPTSSLLPRFPVLHRLPELAQTHVHWVSDAIQPSRSLSSPSPLSPSIFPCIRVFSNVSALCIRWPKYWSFSFSSSGLFAPYYVGSSWTRDQTHVPCIGRWILIHRTNRQVHKWTFFSFFKKTFNSRVVLDLQVYHKVNREFPYIRHLVYCILNILHLCGTLITVSKPILIHYYSVNPYLFGFP